MTKMVGGHIILPLAEPCRLVCFFHVFVLLSIFGLQCFDTAGWVAGRASSLYLVPAHPGSPGKRAVKRVCVCVFVLLSWPFDYFWLVVVSSGRWHQICCLGQVNIRTHTSARVVNRASRFHRSAGLEDIGFHSSSGRESPCNASASPSSSPGWVLLYSFAIYLHNMSAVHYASGRLACEIAYSSCQAIVSHRWHFVFLNAFICFIINDSNTTAILAIVIVCSHSMENWM